ncbi:MAG: OmpA family protein [Desulfuromonadales bacterium]|nr:OmpA family protein [Desulfuromonadales bacterium]
MRFQLVLLLLSIGFVFYGSNSWGDTAQFNNFFEHRELVASVTFDRGSSKLSKSSAGLLEAALPQIRGPSCEARLIRIEGFSGQEGTDEAAFRLSMNRAYSVASFLETKGIPCLVGINGYGNLRPGQNGNVADMRVEIASYPKMYLFDFASARYVDMEEVKFHD